MVIGRTGFEQDRGRDMQEYTDDNRHNLIKILGNVADITFTYSFTCQKACWCHNRKDEQKNGYFCSGKTGVQQEAAQCKCRRHMVYGNPENQLCLMSRS